MREWNLRALCVLSVVAVAPAVSGQSIRTDANIETEAQFVSKVSTGTAPLVVSSSTIVSNLNADQVDGLEGTDLALDADLQNVEIVLVALQAQADAVGLALVPRTGQMICHDAAGMVVTCSTGVGPGQDGDLRVGAVWPDPRFTKNGDGTVTDHLTELIWLEDANCFGGQIWSDALAKANALSDGCVSCGGTGNDCGLSDGSLAGTWRLPNIRELESLVNYGAFSPAVPDTQGTGQWSEGDPFSAVETSLPYWSSSSLAPQDPPLPNAWMVDMDIGGITAMSKTSDSFVWPVRCGQ